MSYILKYNIIPEPLLNEYLEFTPVDECANAIVTLLTNTIYEKYIFHIFNNNSILVRDFINTIKLLGFNIQTLPGTTFKNSILELNTKFSKDNILRNIINNLDNQTGLSLHSEIIQNNNFTNYYLNKCNFNWHNIDNNYLNKIIDYMRKNNYI